jgi:hypothetical protein
MLETSNAPGKRVPKYEQLFGQDNLEDVKRYEKFEGTVEEAIKGLRAGLEDKDTSVYVPIYRSWELMKASIINKIDVDATKKHNELIPAIKAVELSRDIMLSCFQRDGKTALSNLDTFKKLVTSSGEKSTLQRMLAKRVEEKPDLAFLPSCVEEEDFNIAEQLLNAKNGTGGEPILMIGIGFRGAWRIPEIFLEYQDLSDTPTSMFYLVRFSPHYYDRLPRLAVPEMELLKKESVGRRIVVVGAKERSRLASEYFNKVVFGKDANIITVPLKLTEPNGNGYVTEK